MSKNSKINVQGTAITIVSENENDFISLTDMVKNFEGGSSLIENWFKNKDTILFLGVWEQINNPNFNSIEFEGIKNEAGRNSNNLGVPQGSGFQLYLFCEKTKKDAASIPHAKKRAI